MSNRASQATSASAFPSHSFRWSGFTSRPDIMGAWVNRRATTVTDSAVAPMIISLNVYPLFTLLVGWSCPTVQRPHRYASKARTSVEQIGFS